MPFIGNKPSAVPLTSADIADSIITSAKIVDATITNSDVASSIITGQTAETSIAGGDSVLIYDDSAAALRKMTRTNFVSGLSVANTPSFYAVKGDAQTFATGTGAKVQFNTEIFDTDNCYDPTTNYRFTPTTAGKYFVGASMRWSTDVDIDIAVTTIYKNGSVAFEGSFTNLRYNNWFLGSIVSMNGTTDYLEVYATQYSGSNKDNYTDGNQFFAYKLIGV
jgi:hypothetical protein